MACLSLDKLHGAILSYILICKGGYFYKKKNKSPYTLVVYDNTVKERCFFFCGNFTLFVKVHHQTFSSKRQLGLNSQNLMKIN